MLASIPDVTREHEALIQFLYLAPVGLVQASLDGDIEMINPISAQLLMPLSKNADLTNLFDALASVAPDLRERVSDYDKPHGMVCDAVRLVIGAQGGGRVGPQMLSLTILKLDALRMMVVLNDITQQVARERLLRQNEAWLHAVLTGITDYALIRLDASGRVDGWNPSIGRVTGFTAQEVLGQPFSIFYPACGGVATDRLFERLREADESGWSLDDGWRMRSDGSRFWGSALISPLRERGFEAPATFPPHRAGDEPAYCLVIRDITDKREEVDRQRRATACDHLTGIANRRAFFEAAEVEMARGSATPRHLSLVVFDVDDLDALVDRHGRPAADTVLQHLAALLTATFREFDVVARLGSGQFAVLLPSTDLADAKTIAERLRQTVFGKRIRLAGPAIHHTVSGGIATVDDDDAVDLTTLLERAGGALASARAQGSNRIECWSSSDLDALA